MPNSNSKPEVIAILLAAGSGNRFQHGQSQNFDKVLMDLCGKPVWQHSVEAFQGSKLVTGFCLVVAESQQAYLLDQYGSYLANQSIKLVTGGQHRWQSVNNALSAVAELGPDMVAIHDAARPCIQTKSIDLVIETASRTGAAILAQPLWGTIKQADENGNISKTVPREGLYQATTPQVFRWDWICEAYSDANIKRFKPEAITDDAQLMAEAGHKVSICHDLPTNIKLTTREDLIVAEAFLKTL
jgi:2-C-methyl-D-erythritol 4-phosphate cytidylyltransferase